jgi:diaminopimelate decarboxylase
VGADLLLRRCYRPEDWHHELWAFDDLGNAKGDDLQPYVVSGPLCFAGDIIGREAMLPRLTEGDFIGILDTGAYTIGMWSRYNSRQMPKVIGYLNDGEDFTLLREKESPSDLVNFWAEAG